QRHLGQKSEALRSFRVFLTKVPNTPQRPQVERLMAELQAAIDQDNLAAERPPTSAMGTPQTLETHPAETPPPPKKVEAPPPKKVEAPPPKKVKPPPKKVVAVTPPKKPLTPEEERAQRGRTLKLAGVSLLVVGVAGIAVGGAFAGLASSTNHD